MAIRPVGMLRYGFDQLPDGYEEEGNTPAPYEPPKTEDEQRSSDEQQSSYQPQVQQPRTFAQMQEAGYARPPMPAPAMPRDPAPDWNSAQRAGDWMSFQPGPAPQLTAPSSSAFSFVPQDQNTITPTTPQTPSGATVNDAFSVLYGDKADEYRQRAASTGVPPTDAQAWSMFTGSPEEVAAAKQRYNAYAGGQLDAEAEQEAIRAADAFAAGPGFFAGEEGLTAPDGSQTRLDYINDYIRQARGVASNEIAPGGWEGGPENAPSSFTGYGPNGYQPPNPSSATPSGGSGNTANTGGSSQNTGGGFDIWDYIQGNLQGGGSPLSQSVTAKMLEFLNNPNPYGAQEVKDAYSWLGGQIDDEYSLNEQRLGEEMARRGLGQSTNYGGRLQDLNIGKRNAKATLARDLASNFANSYGQNVLGAINAGNNISNADRTSQQSWLDRLIGFGQQGFENDLATEAINQRAAERYQNWILGLLGYGGAS